MERDLEGFMTGVAVTVAIHAEGLVVVGPAHSR